jgi:hypothetical protein
MFIRSTGLGRTLLTGRIATIATTDVVPSTLEPRQDGAEEPMRLLVEIEITNPVHWTVRAFVEPPDLREMIAIILTSPKLMFQCLKFLCRKGPAHRGATPAEAPAEAAVPVPAAPLTTGSAMAPKGPGAIPARKR